MRKCFRSKIDWWLVAIIAIVILIPSIEALRLADTSALIINGLVVAFISYLYRNTYYYIEGNTLAIRAGFLVRSNIAIDQISSIQKTRNPLSAPALSLNRIALRTIDGGYFLLSPRNKDRREFIDSLLSINPEIKVADQLMEPRTF